MRAWVAAGCLCSATAFAHSADLVYAHLQSQHGAALETITLSAPTLVALAPVDVDHDGDLTQPELDARADSIAAGVWDSLPLASGEKPCGRSAPAAALRDGYVELSARFQCPPGELAQTFRILSVLPPNYRVVFESDVDGVHAQAFAQGNEQTLSAPGPATATGAALGLWGWIRLGVFHIFTGYDHLAFLVALLLVAGSWRSLLAMVTSFTVAHSITLGITALGLIPFDEVRQRWAEAAIALSIVYVAAENLALRSHRHRAWITFGFGLVHGFGFAAVLKGYGLGQSRALGLFGFNFGVEVGQACVVAVCYPVVRFVQRTPRGFAWLVRGGSVCTLALGGYWLVDRLFG